MRLIQWFWISLIAVFILGCIILLWYLKPDESLMDRNVLPQHHESFPSNKTNLQSSIEHHQETVIQSENKKLLAQRDALYERFGKLSFDMIEGQKPDLRELSTMLKEHQQLIEAGVISVEDATNYLEFLKKVFPEMENELNFYLNKIVQH